MSELVISARQKEILTLIADGKTAAEIATVQGVTYHTAVANKQRLMARFGVYKETALIAAAFRRGVIS
jgi:LuxR family transcriptional regulator of spore coat protein